MQKILFGIFAHPDDEAFGPVGTLLYEVANGTELHLITLTGGENGSNPDNHPNLGDARLREWHAAGELIGASSMHHFGYVDGALNNLDHQEITHKIVDLTKQITANRHDSTIEFISFDLNGYTGHIDHIVATRSACLAFYRLRSDGLPMHRIRLACLTNNDVPAVNTQFVYMEQGRSPQEINETIDARQYSDKIHSVMQQHHTQRADYETVTSQKGDRLGIDYFMIKE